MLSRRWIVNGLLILSILLVAVIGYRLDMPPGGSPQPSSAVLEQTPVDHIEIETAGASLTLGKDEDGWQILDPVRWPASRANVERLLGLADTGDRLPLAASRDELAALGLENPVARLRLGDTRVSFGTTNNIGERRYTMIDSDVFLLADTQLPFILQGLPGFVDRRLLPPRLSLISLALPGLELRRDDGGAWQGAGRGDMAAPGLQELAGNWQSLEATRIGTFDDARPVRAGIAAELADGERHQFLLLSIDPEIVIANPGLRLQYHFHGRLYNRLLWPFDDENPA